MKNQSFVCTQLNSSQLYPTAERQSMYSTATAPPADWAE